MDVMSVEKVCRGGLITAMVAGMLMTGSYYIKTMKPSQPNAKAQTTPVPLIPEMRVPANDAPQQAGAETPASSFSMETK